MQCAFPIHLQTEHLVKLSHIFRLLILEKHLKARIKLLLFIFQNMTLQIIRFLSLTFVALMWGTPLIVDQGFVVTAFTPSPKIHHHQSTSNLTPPRTTFESPSSNVAAVNHQRNAAPITMIVSAWLLSTMMMVSTPLPAWSQQTDIAKGQVLFQANCAGCHAGGNNYIQEKRTLRKDDIQQYRGSTDQAVIANFVQNGMPHKLLPMKTPMEEQDYNDVVAYVLDQALGEKW